MRFLQACFAAVITGNDCWCWRLGYLDDMEEVRLEEVFLFFRVREEREIAAVFLLESWG